MNASTRARRFYISVVFILSLAAFAAPAAEAETPAHTDVLFLFDTTGSMGGAIQEAQNEVQEAMAQVSTSLPDVQFGLASMADYGTVDYNGQPPVFEYDTADPSAVPWTLHQAITPEQSLITSQLLELKAEGGGDSPEAYGRALFDSATNPSVGWRPGARGIIVLIADDVPHDDELNQGVPESDWVQSPFDTGVDPGADNTLGTADDLDWQSVLQRLITDGKPLEYVDYQGDEAYVPYWQTWAGSTGGSVIPTEGADNEEKLGTKLVEAIQSGALLPTCPTGQARNVAGICVATPPPPAAPPSAAVSNNFKIEPRISCAKGCYVVSVKIVFDSAGNVISESVLDEEPAAKTSSAAAVVSKKSGTACKGKGGKSCKKPALIKAASQPVVAGVNTVTLKLTGAAKALLNKKGKLPLKVKFTFTPTGGATKTSTQTFSIKKPLKKKRKAH